jgi:hypothetical protein
MAFRHGPACSVLLIYQVLERRKDQKGMMVHISQGIAGSARQMAAPFGALI